MKRHAVVFKRHASRVEATGPMDPCSRVCGSRAEVEAVHGRPITEIGKGRAEKKLLIELCTAAAQVAAYQILIHSLQLSR